MKKIFFAVLLLLFCEGLVRAQTNCTASFTYTNISQGVYTFINTSTGFGASPTLSWDFGYIDPTNYYIPDTIHYPHSLSGPITYRVILTVTDGRGCWDTATQFITTTGIPFSCAGSASFTFTNPSPGVYNFTNTSTAPNPMTYVWDLGDGSPSLNTSSPSTISHTYAASGGYCITMTATSATCQDVDTQCIYIKPPSCNAVLTKTGTGLSRTYTVTSNATNPLSYFSACGNWAGYNIVASSTDSTLIITYPQPGYYTIEGWTTTFNNACYDSLFMRDTAVGSINCATLTQGIVFDNFGSGAGMGIGGHAALPMPTYTSTTVWDFGDGTTDTSNNIYIGHYWTSAGNYLVTATTTLTSPIYGSCSVTGQALATVGAPEPSGIYAYCIWDSSMNASGALVKFWLIKYDSASQMLTAVDSTLVPCTAQVPYVYTQWDSVASGDYRVKAHMINQPASWTTGLLPTYFDSSYNWQNAQVINHNYLFYDGAAVYLQQGAPLTGPGFIGGLVTQGANKGTAVGDPIVGLTIFLRDAANNPITSTETDANGMYSFSGVPIGSYSVYPEALNFATTPSANLQITATTTNLAGNNFKYEPVSMQINPVSQGIINSTTSEIHISPNPVKDILIIQFEQAPEKGAIIRLLNLNGQVVYSEAATQAIQQMNVSGLAAGTYLLQVPGVNTTYRISVQK